MLETISPSARAEVRDRLIALVERELCGPYEIDEVTFENPQSRYICGQLAPSKHESDGFDDEEILASESASAASDSDVVDAREDGPTTQGDENSDSDLDAGSADSVETSSIARARRDSLTSIGISFSVRPGRVVSYVAKWGEYERNDDKSYRRVQRESRGTIAIDGTAPLATINHDRVDIRWVVRALADRSIATIFLVNSTKTSAKDGTDRLYQVSLEISCDTDCDGFIPRSDSNSARSKYDVNDLLFRARHEYAVGLHTAVEPTLMEDGRCLALRTATIPRVEMRVTSSRSIVSQCKALDMVWLADNSDADLTCTELAKLLAEYRAWAEDIEDEARLLPEKFEALAGAQRAGIVDRITRLEAGIELIRKDPKAFAAFRFANEAMSRAQFRSKRADREHERRDFKPRDREGNWRPFQIAFLISSLPEIVDPTLPQRRLVDVLFFPTGGGKTEAYLGLAAFAMAHRRIAHGTENGGAGISTLMRYTLRLLTTQQFARASTLICAAEVIRREEKFGTTLGDRPFSIGLWVGPMTPNSYSDAVAAVDRLRREHDNCARSCALSKMPHETVKKAINGRESSNVLPITECPWCFEALCISCVDSNEDARRLIVRCPNTSCEFSGPAGGGVPAIDGLPIFIVDEDIYRMLPTIVVATVDKFATLPFRGEAKNLFGFTSSFCRTCGYLNDAIEHKKHKADTSAVDECRPTDLIIQDELHTITDNLGSIYGLYETAIDFLSTRNGYGPKYVCATATVKDVGKQVKALYGNRRAEVFPPAGLDAGDTFFSRDELPNRTSPGRTYVGIYAPTISRLSTFVAVLSALLAIPTRLRDEANDESIADPYMTLLGYFNTVRDLGGVKALLGDDVPPVLAKIAERNEWQTRVMSDWESELTGRISASEVPDRLKTLNSAYRDGAGCDFMAATNMISVGVDVPRLGLMIVDGQPKSTSEYIQATSRVGRSSPGIVFVTYNAMRPRDLSHYEHFYSYHDSVYRFVEAGSITPFSDGAIDRFLKPAVVACYRMRAAKSDNDSAPRFASDPDAIADPIVEAFRTRARAFGKHPERSAESTLDDLVEKWTASPKNLKYFASTRFAGKNKKSTANTEKKFVVIRASDEPITDSVDALFAASRSMRNVESTVPLLLRIEE